MHRREVQVVYWLPLALEMSALGIEPRTFHLVVKQPNHDNIQPIKDMSLLYIRKKSGWEKKLRRRFDWII